MRRSECRTCGARGAAVGLGAPRAGPWRRAVHRPARPLRHHAGDRAQRFAGLCGHRQGAGRVGDLRRWPRQGARCRPDQPQDRDGRDRGLCHRDFGAGRGGGIADAGVWRCGIPRGNKADLSLSGPAAGKATQEHDVAVERGAVIAQPDVGSGVQRIPDADHHGLLPGRRAGLSGAVSLTSGQILRIAAGAAAVQTADHGVGV